MIALGCDGQADCGMSASNLGFASVTEYMIVNMFACGIQIPLTYPHISSGAANQPPSNPSHVQWNLADPRGCISHRIGASCLFVWHKSSLRAVNRGRQQIFDNMFGSLCGLLCYCALGPLVLLLQDLSPTLLTMFCCFCFNALTSKMQGKNEMFLFLQHDFCGFT